MTTIGALVVGFMLGVFAAVLFTCWLIYFVSRNIYIEETRNTEEGSTY